jgi:hypothetical protein
MQSCARKSAPKERNLYLQIFTIYLLSCNSQRQKAEPVAWGNAHNPHMPNRSVACHAHPQCDFFCVSLRNARPTFVANAVGVLIVLFRSLSTRRKSLTARSRVRHPRKHGSNGEGFRTGRGQAPRRGGGLSSPSSTPATAWRRWATPRRRSRTHESSAPRGRACLQACPRAKPASGSGPRDSERHATIQDPTYQAKLSRSMIGSIRRRKQNWHPLRHFRGTPCSRNTTTTI